MIRVLSFILCLGFVGSLATAVWPITPAENLHLFFSKKHCQLGNSRADGCAGAQTTGSYMIPNFFTGFTGTKYPVRPPWNVAGVDYPVGYTGGLADPSIAGKLPACATYAANLVTVNSSPCTIDHFDFTRQNGIGLRISSSINNATTVTVTNNKFSFGSGFDPAIPTGMITASGGMFNLTLKYNHLDGIYAFSDTCAGGCPAGLVVYNAVGTLTAQYNAFLNTNQQDLQYNAGGQTLIAEYNYVQRVGFAPTHGDWVISNASSGTQILIEDHNTVYGGPVGAAGNATAFCYVTSFSNPVNISATCSYDTYVSTHGSDVSAFVEISGGQVGTTNLSHNWYDATGPFWPMISMNFAGSSWTGPTTCVDNFSLLDGTAITGPIPESTNGATVTGNSPFSCTVTGGAVADTTPPSVPTSLAGTGVSASQINLTWTASTDNVGVTGYKIFRNAMQVGTSATASYSDTGLAASTAYTYKVSAYDAAGNPSAQTAGVVVSTQASGGTCPQGNAFADGCAGAQAAISPQYPTLLNTYGANRPPWNVPGVDYAVGYQSGALKNPTVGANLPACASFNAGAQQWVAINSVPCTIDHFDFTVNNCVGLQAVGLNAPGSSLTVTNNKFCGGSSWNPGGNGMINSNSNINHIIRFNTFDEAYNASMGSVISLLVTPSTATIEYNLFLRTNQAVTNWTGTGTFTIRYNAMKGLGANATHGDWFIINNGGAVPLHIAESFNLVDSDETSCCATAHCYASMAGPGAQDVSCKNDVNIALISTAADGPPGNGTVSYIVRLEPQTGNGPFTFTDNYMDLTGTIGPFFAGAVSGGGSVTTTCTGNKNLNTGATIAYSSATMTCN